MIEGLPVNWAAAWAHALQAGPPAPAPQQKQTWNDKRVLERSSLQDNADVLRDLWADWLVGLGLPDRETVRRAVRAYDETVPLPPEIPQ